MRLLLTIAGYVSAAVLLLGVGRRWILRPIVTAVKELRQLVAEIRSAQHVALDLSALAGATTHLATELMTSRFQDQQRLDEISELVTDLNADVIRLGRDLAQLKNTA